MTGVICILLKEEVRKKKEKEKEKIVNELSQPTAFRLCKQQPVLSKDVVKLVKCCQREAHQGRGGERGCDVSERERERQVGRRREEKRRESTHHQAPVCHRFSTLHGGPAPGLYAPALAADPRGAAIA